ncbi:MAG: hypothetical protein SGI99_13120 [Pseudomonadota bacterium]|nr:hypothetical protein [Pseudomonadota bacterium]
MRPNSVLAIAFSLGLCACVTQDVQLDRRHVEGPSTRALMGRLSCKLPSFDLVDVRPYQGLGWINGRELLYPELASWIRDALHGAATVDANAQPLLIEINRAYIETHPSSHSFQLVLRVRANDDSDTHWRVYRGNESGVTWWGNDAEFGEYVEDAGKSALGSLIKSEGNCS